MDQLRKLAPEAPGGEMEGTGLYSAAQRKKVDWLLVKAVCDWADGKKERTRKHLNNWRQRTWRVLPCMYSSREDS